MADFTDEELKKAYEQDFTDEELLAAYNQDSAPTYSEDGVLQINLNDNAPKKQPLTPRENIVGGMGNLLDAGTFGLGDEITAGGSATLDSLFGDSSFGDAYDERLSQMRGIQKQYGEENPITSTVSNIAAGFANPINALGKFNNIQNAAITGAGFGGAFGFGEGEGGFGERVSNAGTGGLYGAVTGAGLRGAMDVGKGAINKVNNWVNTPSKIAKKWFGATTPELSPESGKSLVPDVEAIQGTPSNSILTQPNQGKTYKELVSRMGVVGQRLESVYQRLEQEGRKLSYTLDDLQSLPEIQALKAGASPDEIIEIDNALRQEFGRAGEGIKSISGPSGSRAIQKEVGFTGGKVAEGDLPYLEQPTLKIPGRESVPGVKSNVAQELTPTQIWNISQRIEQGLKYNKPREAQEGIGDKASKIVSKTFRDYLGAIGGEDLASLNKEYSSLAGLRRAAGDEAGIEAAADVLQNLNLNNSGVIAPAGLAYGVASANPIVTGISAVTMAARGVNKATNSPYMRRSIYRLASAINSKSNLLGSDIGKLAIMGSTLLPRSSEALAQDPENFSQEIGHYLMQKFNDEELASTVSQEVRDIAINGNKMVQDEVIRGLVQQFPDAFEPAPEGYQSFMDGKILDPMEQSIHINKALDKDLTPRQQAEVIGGMLSKKKYAPIDTAQSPQGPVRGLSPEFNGGYFNPLDVFKSAMPYEDVVEVPYSGTEQTGDMLRVLQDSLTIREEYDPMTAR